MRGLSTHLLSSFEIFVISIKTVFTGPISRSCSLSLFFPARAGPIMRAISAIAPRPIFIDGFSLFKYMRHQSGKTWFPSVSLGHEGSKANQAVDLLLD